MALQNGKPNPLNYFKMRRVIYACQHFKYFTMNKYNPYIIKIIDEWIIKNLNGRYYIGQGIMLDNNNTIVYNTTIGFENETEVSFFIISCPHINIK